MSGSNYIAPFATTFPDTVAATGPLGTQKPVGEMLITPTGGAQGKLADFLGTSSSTTKSSVAIAAAAADINNPRTAALFSPAPAITIAASWIISTAYLAGEVVITYTGSGATALANYYICVIAGTSAGSGGGPTGGGAGIVDNTVTWNFVRSLPGAVFANLAINSYMWGTLGSGRAGIGGVVYTAGGTPTNNAGSTSEIAGAATTIGVLVQTGARFSFVTDATIPVVRINATNTNPIRILVNNQFISLTPTLIAHSGFGTIVLDFTAAGGRAVRTITIEMAAFNCRFVGIDVGITEGVYLPVQSQTLVVVGAGDSIMLGVGATLNTNGFFYILADALGARNAISTGVSGTGYLVSTTSGTALSRISDVTNQVTAAAANGSPTLIIDENGYNDASLSIPAVQAACLLYLQTLRATIGPIIPIVVTGIWPSNNVGVALTNLTAVEAAKKAVVAQLVAAGDRHIFFVPIIGAIGGSLITGTGSSTAPNSTGNADVYVNGANLPHPTDAGHNFLAQYLLGQIKQLPL